MSWIRILVGWKHCVFTLTTLACSVFFRDTYCCLYCHMHVKYTYWHLSALLAGLWSLSCMHNHLSVILNFRKAIIIEVSCVQPIIIFILSYFKYFISSRTTHKTVGQHAIEITRNEGWMIIIGLDPYWLYAMQLAMGEESSVLRDAKTRFQLLFKSSISSNVKV